MSKSAPVNKITVLFSVLLLVSLILTFQSCRKKRSEMGNKLFKQTHNKIFKDASPEGFSVVFKKVFAEQRSKLRYADFIMACYQKNHYEPVFVMDHLFNGDLDKADDYLAHADEHGLNAAMFQADELKAQIAKFHQKPGIKTLDEGYRDMADLELTAANSLISYSNALQYGVINPKDIYQRYFIATKRPDSNAMASVFQISNMQSYLDSIQPKNPQYIALQSALKNNYLTKGFSGEEAKRIILVNLERLRWRNKPYENKYVIVNIPDFTLDVVDSGKSVLNMKVCVGQGRNMDYANTLEAYNDTCKEDKPGEHETPLLNSLIYGVEVNPVWNIPKSIANKEIIVEAAKDKFYLDNNNIEVYKDDRLVDDPEDIDWTRITKDNLPYDFKQKPGSDNSLGLIKFMFNNKSNVYLHDTPVKWAFSKKMRAISHGCVRLGDPKGLALSLFGQGEKFQNISDVMGNEDTDPTMIYLPRKVPVYITYVTCWADENGKVQLRKDVYGLDIVLFDHLQQVLHADM
jgi:murein L,D-transpeptidase YcbB/YkuD